MFQVGNFVLNATNGICEIKDVVSMNMSGTEKDYFLLVPVEEKSAKVYIPVDVAENRIRLVLSKDEAMDIIKSIPDIEEAWVENEKEREHIYKEAMNSKDPIRLIGIIKTLYRRKMERLDAGKKCTAIDERYFKMAENQLFAELGFALGEPKQNMRQIIKDACATTKGGSFPSSNLIG